MSWITDIIARLEADSDVTDLVSTRIYPAAAPSDASTPFVVWQRIGCGRVDSHDGASGLATQMLQISAFDEDYSDAQSVMDEVRASLDGADGTIGSTTGVRIRFIDESDIPDLTPESEPRQLYGIQHTYEVWHNE